MGRPRPPAPSRSMSRPRRSGGLHSWSAGGLGRTRCGFAGLEGAAPRAHISWPRGQLLRISPNYWHFLHPPAPVRPAPRASSAARRGDERARRSECACPLAGVLDLGAPPARLGLLEAAFRAPPGRRGALGAAGTQGGRRNNLLGPPWPHLQAPSPRGGLLRASGAVGAEGALPLSPPPVPSPLASLQPSGGRGSSGKRGCGKQVRPQRGTTSSSASLTLWAAGRGPEGSSVVQTPPVWEAAGCPLLSLDPPWDLRGSVQSPGIPGRSGGLGAGSTHPAPTRGPGHPADRREGRGLGSGRLLHTTCSQKL